MKTPRQPTPAVKYAYVGHMLKLYRRAWKIVKSGGKIVMFWNSSPLDLAGFREEFTNALNQRINCKAGIALNCRKASEQYQTDLQRDAADLRKITQQRIRVYQFRTPDVRSRFGHLLARYDD